MGFFDDIYGKGSLDELREVADWSPEWPLLSLKEEGDCLIFSWDGPTHGGPMLRDDEFGSASIRIVSPELWHWGFLAAANSTSLWYSRTVYISQWAIEHGVTTVRANPVSPEATEVFIRGGFDEAKQGESYIEAPLQRLVDYAWWKLGKEGYEEPDWHIAIRQNDE